MIPVIFDPGGPLSTGTVLGWRGGDVGKLIFFVFGVCHVYLHSHVLVYVSLACIPPGASTSITVQDGTFWRITYYLLGKLVPALNRLVICLFPP